MYIVCTTDGGKPRPTWVFGNTKHIENLCSLCHHIITQKRKPSKIKSILCKVKSSHVMDWSLYVCILYNGLHESFAHVHVVPHTI